MSFDNIPLSWALRQCGGAIREGISQEVLLDQCLISPRYGDDRDQISPAQMTLLYMTICNTIEDEAHGMAGNRIELGYSALAIRAALGCPDLETAVNAIIRLYRLASSGIQLSLSHEGDEAALAIRFPDERTGAEAMFLEDCYLSFFFMCFSHFLGQPMPLIAVETRDPHHMNLGSRHWASRAMVRPGRVSRMRIPKAALRMRRSALPGEVSYRDLFGIWLDFVQTGPAIDLAGLRGVAELSVEDLARQEGVSRSTIRRRLYSQSLTFREERQRVLVESAIQMLQHSGDSVDSIAVWLGYSDARSFRRFMKNATGRTPADIRSERAGTTDSLVAREHAVARRIEALAEAMSA